MRVFAETLSRLISATVTLFAAYSSLAPAQDLAMRRSSTAAVLEEIPNDWQRTDRLETHAGVRPRRVSSGKCEAEGERELVKLSASAETEEAYLFIPDLCAWIDVGYSESPNSVRMDTDAIHWAARRFPEIALYHIHPGPPEEAAGYFPAYSDLLNVILIDALRQRERINTIRHRAVSSAGVIDYAFHPSAKTSALVTHMIETGLSAHVTENLALIYSGSARVNAYHDAVRACETRAPVTWERPKACFPMVIGEFTLTFRSVETEVQ